MSADQPNTETPSRGAEQPKVAASNGNWVATILIASVIAWVGYNFPPMSWKIPDSMANIGALSSQADQDRLAENMNGNAWKNSLMKFTLAGAGFGLAGFVLNGFVAHKNWIAAVVTLVTGLISGSLAGTFGLLTRRHFDLDHPIPFISAESRPLFCDSIVFALVSVLVLLPIAVLLAFQPDKTHRHKAFVIPFAGILTGLLVPLTVALLFSTTSTGIYPPVSLDLTTLWFAAMACLTLLLVVFHGSRAPKAESAAE